MIVLIILLCVILIGLYFFVNVYFDGARTLLVYFIYDWIKSVSIEKAKTISKKRVEDYRQQRKNIWK